LRWRHFIANGPIGYEVAPAVGYTRLHLRASDGSVNAEESVSSPVLELTIGVIGRLRKTTSIEVNGTLFNTNSKLDNVSRYQMVLIQTLGRHITLEGGYAKWTADSPSAVRSAVRTESSGPSIGMHFTF
jgi:hypothetical protein